MKAGATKQRNLARIVVAILSVPVHAVAEEGPPITAPTTSTEEPSEPPPAGERDSVDGPPAVPASDPVPPAAPAAAPAPESQPVESDAPVEAAGEAANVPSWYLRKEDSPHVDLFSAWGWENRAYFVTLGLMNLYLHDPGDRFGFHARMLAVGALSFERDLIAADGSASSERKTAFVLGILDPSIRFYLVGPVFLSGGANVGVAFYDGPTAYADPNTGLGFAYSGWGLEAGVRWSRLTRAATFVNGKRFVHSEYGLQVFAALETSISW